MYICVIYSKILKNMKTVKTIENGKIKLVRIKKTKKGYLKK